MKITWRAPVNLFLALARVVKAKVRRESVFLDSANVKARLDRCEGIAGVTEKCPYFDPECRQCLACECLVDIKALISTETCPKRRWTKPRL
jgi:hypothetical protein